MHNADLVYQLFLSLNNSTVKILHALSCGIKIMRILHDKKFVKQINYVSVFVNYVSISYFMYPFYFTSYDLTIHVTFTISLTDL